MIRLLFGLLGLALAGTISAHPHSYVDQQVQVALGLDRAEITVMIVPSAQDGAAIFAQLDLDGDGAVDDHERAAFRRAVLAAAAFTVDDEPVPLGAGEVTVSAPALLAAGAGPIELRTTARFDPLGPGTHVLRFAIQFDAFDHDWFVQPFYFNDLIAAGPSPELTRSADGSTVTVSITIGGDDAK